MRMKKFLITLILVASVVACGSKKNQSISTSKPKVVEPVVYGYVVKNVYPHSTKSYTQGLQYVDGVMWEGTGEWGKSVLQTIDLESGKTNVLAHLPKSEFGEGITVLGDKVYQLTWTNNLVHIYNLEGKLLRNERYPGEGWGLTTDGQTLYMSDGSTYIYRVNPETFKREGKITVTLRGHAIEYINELEWIEGKIWANVYTANEILIIDPATGIVEGVVSFSDLQKAEDIKANTDVFNGIAYDKEQKRIFVTGKNWNKLYEIEIVKR